MMGESAPIQRWVQLAGYALIVGAALMVLSPFLVPLAWAAILAFATWRPYERVRRGLGGRAWLPAPLLPALLGLPVVVPAGRLSLAPAARARRPLGGFRRSRLTRPARAGGSCRRHSARSTGWGASDPRGCARRRGRPCAQPCRAGSRARSRRACPRCSATGRPALARACCSAPRRRSSR